MTDYFLSCHKELNIMTFVHFRVHRLKEEDMGNAASGSDGLTPLQEAAHAQLPKLTSLRTLVLKDFGGAKVTEHLTHQLSCGP